MDGLRFLQQYRALVGKALVVIMGEYGETDLALEAMRKGACDFVMKPFTAGELLLTVRKAEERERLRTSRAVD